MKKICFFILAFLVLGTLSNCKKKVEKKAEDYIIDIMTDGKWYMYEYLEDGLDITYEFAGYDFQFYKEGTVYGIRDNIAKTGTWKGELVNYTITANFNTAGEPLSKLNNTWKITDSYTNAVFAEATFGTSLNKIKLVKR